MASKSAPVTLSRCEGLGSITMCGCGVVSLHLAGVTLRLQAGVFSLLEQMVVSAEQALQAREAALNSMAATGPVSSMIQ